MTIWTFPLQVRLALPPGNQPAAELMGELLERAVMVQMVQLLDHSTMEPNVVCGQPGKGQLVSMTTSGDDDACEAPSVAVDRLARRFYDANPVSRYQAGVERVLTFDEAAEDDCTGDIALDRMFARIALNVIEEG